MATYLVPVPTPWDALARDLLGSEALMAELLAENPGLARLPECPAGTTVALPDVATGPTTAGADVPSTLPPWVRTAGGGPAP